MGDLLGSFLKKRASEDKACWKHSCWSVGSVIDPGSSQSDVLVYKSHSFRGCKGPMEA